MLRSGSCTEIGLKQCMEDEHICIDDLVDHIGEDVNISLPGAFYGVHLLYVVVGCNSISFFTDHVL